MAGTRRESRCHSDLQRFGVPRPSAGQRGPAAQLGTGRIDAGAEFGSTTYDYEVASPASAMQTIVAAIPLDPDAVVAITVDGVSAEADGTVDISPDTETVTVKVTAEDGVSTQTYTLSVRDFTPPDDLPADTSTSGMVEVDGSAVRGDILKPKAKTATWTTTDSEGNEVEHESIVYDFDTDWFEVELEAGGTYRIEMKGAIPTNELTLRLPQINAIYDADGDYLFNTWARDESDSHHLFRVTFHAHDDGTYYIAASGESFEWGSYELRVKDITEDAG